MIHPAAIAGAVALVPLFVRPSPNFSWAELTTTSTGLANEPDVTERARLIRLCWLVLEPLRSVVGPLRVTSAFRSKAVNDAVGGAAMSYHRQGLAADLYDADGEYNNGAIAGVIRALDLPVDEVIVEHHTGHLHVAVSTFGSAPKRKYLQTWDGSSYSGWA
jgi:hypothetical protein